MKEYLYQSNLIDFLKDRIKDEFKIDVYMGPLQIAYRELIQEEVTKEHVLERKIGNHIHKVSVCLTIKPSPGSGMQV